MAKSTIIIPYRGVIEFTGEHDTGKTLAMLQTVRDFSKTAFVDDDVKGDGTVKQLAEQGTNFELYIDLAKERLKISKTPTADEVLEHIVFPLIDKLTEKHHDVIIFDTWRIIYQAARGHVERNQPKYAGVVRWQGSSQIIQGLISKVARMIEREALTRLKDSCDLLLISHHVKANYKANVEIGVIPESSATFDEICNMRIWLKKNPQSGVPIMLFLKRPNIPTMTNKGLRPVNIVPVKIIPSEKHESIWDAIAEYEKNPIGNRPPRLDETPTKEELATISGTMTDEQVDYVKRMMEYNKQLENDLSEVQTIRQSVAETPPEGSGRMKSSIPDSYPVNGIQLISRAKAELGFDLNKVIEVLEMPFAQINELYEPKHWDVLLNHQSNGQAKKQVKKK